MKLDKERSNSAFSSLHCVLSGSYTVYGLFHYIYMTKWENVLRKVIWLKWFSSFLVMLTYPSKFYSIMTKGLGAVIVDWELMYNLLSRMSQIWSGSIYTLAVTPESRKTYWREVSLRNGQCCCGFLRARWKSRCFLKICCVWKPMGIVVLELTKMTGLQKLSEEGGRGAGELKTSETGWRVIPASSCTLLKIKVFTAML